MESTISRLRHTRDLARFSQNLVFYDNWHFGIKRKTERENLTVAFLFLTGICTSKQYIHNMDISHSRRIPNIL